VPTGAEETAPSASRRHPACLAFHTTGRKRALHYVAYGAKNEGIRNSATGRRAIEEWQQESTSASAAQQAMLSTGKTQRVSNQHASQRRRLPSSSSSALSSRHASEAPGSATAAR